MKREPSVYMISATAIRTDGSGPNYVLIAQFGNIKYLVENGEYPVFNDTIRDKILNRLKDFNYEADYIVWGGGDPLSALLVGNCLAEIGVPSIRWLRLDRKYDARTGQRSPWFGNYTPVTIHLADFEFIEDNDCEDLEKE